MSKFETRTDKPHFRLIRDGAWVIKFIEPIRDNTMVGRKHLLFLTKLNADLNYRRGGAYV